MEPLSARNPRVQHLRRLSGRRRSRVEHGSFVIDGPTLLADALDAGVEPTEVFVDESARDDVLAALCERAARAGAAIRHVRAGVLRAATDVTTPQGVAAVAPLPRRSPSAVVGVVTGFAVVLAGVADPGNVGTIVRTAEAAGADAVMVGTEGADPFSPKAVRASAGSVFRMPVAVAPVAELLAGLAGAGVHAVGAGADGSRAYDDVEPAWPLALVLGNEARGLPPEVRAQLSEVVRIPMAPPVESVNVATAAAVLCFDLARRRRRR